MLRYGECGPPLESAGRRGGALGAGRILAWTLARDKNAYVSGGDLRHLVRARACIL